MINHGQINPKGDEQRKLHECLHSGHSLNAKVLAFHLGVDRNTATRIAKAQGLAPEGSTYTWRRIWWQIHNIEYSLLASHLEKLRTHFPKSRILGGIDNIEVTLRTPLVKYPGMAAMLREHPDTLRKQIDRGDRNIPFPVLSFGPRLQLFRPLDIILWREEELLLDLPKAENPAPKPKAKATAKSRPHKTPVDRKKAIFPPGGRTKRKAAG